MTNEEIATALLEALYPSLKENPSLMKRKRFNIMREVIKRSPMLDNHTTFVVEVEKTASAAKIPVEELKLFYKEIFGGLLDAAKAREDATARLNSRGWPPNVIDTMR